MVTKMLAVVGMGAVAVAGCSTDGDSTDAGATDQPAAAQADAQAAAGDAAPVGDTVTVVGRGEAEGQPDVVRVRVGVEVTSDSAERAFDTASERASEVIEALREAGVAEDDIQTQELSVREERDRPPRPEAGAEEPEGPAGPVGIVATNVLEVRIGDVDEAGAVLEAASDAAEDVTRIRGVRFEVSETDPLLETARQRAFEDARGKAEQYAQLADRELGELVSIREAGAAPGPSASPSAEEVDAAAPVEPGTQELTVQITAVWSFG
ncbi:MAG: SIMPL domain-containing protein [Nitriliruptoraceae bacterium]